ncbi:hypothetical protein HYQ46_005252 [Verticillium longisporum]|nr:hypothetical protein HYQ44_013072 [Verticillium longisporum]KAG7145957.1 hypothetical protein HYQ46_005252 [Verticillium longisporum]
MSNAQSGKPYSRGHSSHNQDTTLTISYLINGEDFFRACTLASTWPSLETLALTSPQLQPTRGRRSIFDLLHRAGTLALQTPKLRLLVLWMATEDDACAFIYQAHHSHATITWRGTWDLGLESSVVDIWRNIGLQSGLSFYHAREKRIEEVITCRGDGIHHLKSPCEVVTPASLRQMRREGNTYQSEPYAEEPSPSITQNTVDSCF